MKITKLLLPFMACVFLFSCSSGDGAVNRTNSYNMQNISDGLYLLEHEETVIYPHGDRLYAANPNGGVGYYDTMSADFSYTPISDSAGLALYANDTEFFFFDGNDVFVTDLDGNVTASWSDVYETMFESGGEAICANDKTVFLFHTEYETPLKYEAYITIIDRVTGEASTRAVERKINGIIGVVSEADGDDYDICASCAYEDGTEALYTAVMKYDTADGSLKTLRELDTGHSCGDYVDGELYNVELANGTYRLYHVGDENTNEYLRNIDSAGLHDVLSTFSGLADEEYTPNMLFFTGCDMIMWSKHCHVAAIYDASAYADGETLNVMYPTQSSINDVDYDIMRFENEYECSVKARVYPAGDYDDRLRMLLLSGDDDLDVVYIANGDSGELLSSILRYSLYLPLENYDSVTKNYESYIDGTREFMTVDDHLIGVPIRFGGSGYIVTKAFCDTGLTIPDADWTLDDFWTLCEESIPYVGGSVALTQQNVFWILNELLQDGSDNGSMDRDAFVKVFTNLKKYYDLGVLSTYSNASTFLLENRVYIPDGQISYNYDSDRLDFEIAGVIPNPTVSESRHASLSAFAFVYGKTKNEDLAVSYMEYISTPENVYRADANDTYFLKDKSGYYTEQFNPYRGRENEESADRRTVWVKAPIEFSEKRMSIFEYSANAFVGTKIMTVSESDISGTERELLERLYAGVISPEEAADELVNFAKYRYLE